MKRALTVLAAGVLVLSGMLTSSARADVDGANGTNVQDGRNSATTNQSGRGKAGSAVGGQVAGVVTGGRASIDAHNTSRDADLQTGDATGSNSAGTFVGLNTNTAGGPVISDIANSCRAAAACANVQDGSNRYTLNQTLSAVTGDGVGGQVIGLIGGGTGSITAANSSDNVDVTTGDASGTNQSAAFVGLNRSSTGPSITADLTNVCTTAPCPNVQDGSDRISSSQSVNTASGDGVAGQVIGAVTTGSLSINARNTTTDSSVETGDATGDNSASYFVGLNVSPTGTALTADITGSCVAGGCSNVQTGADRLSTHQSVRSTSGDGVAGGVIGAVSLRGSVRVTAANRTVDSDVTSGPADASNDLGAFVGLNANTATGTVVSDITNSCNGPPCDNVQDGSDRVTGSQLATAASGDGVAGEVIGIQAAGSAWLDATNRSDDVSADTGESNAHNDASTFVGLNSSGTGPTITDISGAKATNLQDGGNRKTMTQTASATSGDAVAGQVSGVVTGAGGAHVAVANSSTNVDASSGASDFSNEEQGFVGLNVSKTGPLIS